MWVLLVGLLPFSSVPLVSYLVHSDSVAAPSALPLFWLSLIWFIPFIIKGGRLPHVTLGALALTLVALISSAAAFFIDVPSFKGISILSREMQALLTLAIGMAFYLVVSAWPRDTRKLHITLQVINISGGLMLAWAVLEAYYMFKVGVMPAWMEHIQNVVDLKGFYPTRVSGVAYEPSWYGHMLNILYLPIWLAATLKGYTAQRYRLIGITLENVLLVAGVGTLFLSFSRVGWLALGLVLVYLLISAALWIGGRLHRWIIDHLHLHATSRWLVSTGVSAVLVVAFLGGFGAGFFEVVRFGGHYDPRLQKIFSTDLFEGGIYKAANNMSFAERLVFWASGWEVFNDHPVLGVGLGNAGYYFPAKMPTFGWSLVEVRTDIFLETTLPNTKSIWARLLSETGLLGFTCWLVWLYMLWQSTRYLRTSQDKMLRSIGLAGMLALIALLVEGFSIDSFALPYIWVIMGIVSAASSVRLLEPSP
jgi:O-antigen ligase